MAQDNQAIQLRNLPQSPAFTPITIPQSNSLQSQNNYYNQVNKDIHQYERNKRINQNLSKELEKEFKDDLDKYPIITESKYALTKSYWDALEKLTVMSDRGNDFSLTDAVFQVENAFFDGKLPLDKFKTLIAKNADLCRYVIGQNKLNPKDNLAINYAIQKLFSQNIKKYNAKTKSYTLIHAPLKYDFNDYMGDKDWTKMFVSKLLISGKGQCHSMPLLYLLLAEQLGGKAYLCLAPEHSYIEFFDNSGTPYDFETTSGMLVSHNWIMQSGFINANAIKNKIYLDTLDKNKLIAYMLTDLTLGYLQKFGYDDFVFQTLQKIKSYSPNNLQLLMIESNYSTTIAMQSMRSIGSPPIEKLKNYPETYKLYNQMLNSYAQIDNLGYQPIPPEAYQQWLQSLQQAKQKQENEEMKELLKTRLKSKRVLNDQIKK